MCVKRCFKQWLTIPISIKQSHILPKTTLNKKGPGYLALEMQVLDGICTKMH